MVKIGHASIDERNKISGGKKGDQTGKEICIREWYSKPWNVMLVCTDTSLASRAAEYMKAICENDSFGYDQSERTTGYLNIVNAKNKVENALPGEFDCSSLVASCYKLAGLNINHNCTTRNLKQALLNTKKFVAYTDSEHLHSDAYATVGAIYLKEGSHVVMALENGSKTIAISAVTHANINIAQNESIIWKFFKDKKMSDYAIAGIMGNLYAESGLSQINLQNTGNQKLGVTDAEYTAAVDSGTYTNFIKDSQGYGLAQWTYWTRKKNLYEYAKRKNKSIGDLTMQLEFLYDELKSGYGNCYNKLIKVQSVMDASNAMLLDFEKPKDQSVTVQKRRAAYSQVYYDKYSQKTGTTSSSGELIYQVGKDYALQTELNVRKGAGTSFSKKTWSELTESGKSNDKNKNGALDNGTVITCLEVKKVGQDIWIRIPSGWVAAYYQNKYYVK